MDLMYLTSQHDMVFTGASPIRCVSSILRISCLCCLFTLLSALLINHEVKKTQPSGLMKPILSFFSLVINSLEVVSLCFPHGGLETTAGLWTYPVDVMLTESSDVRRSFGCFGVN